MPHGFQVVELEDTSAFPVGRVWHLSISLVRMRAVLVPTNAQLQPTLGPTLMIWVPQTPRRAFVRRGTRFESRAAATHNAAGRGLLVRNTRPPPRHRHEQVPDTQWKRAPGLKPRCKLGKTHVTV